MITVPLACVENAGRTIQLLQRSLQVCQDLMHEFTHSVS